MMRLFRSAYVIGRRDFGATVLSKAFLFFLLGPVFPLLLGGVFGGIGATVASQTERSVVAVVSSPQDFARLSSARKRLADGVGEETLVTLVHYAPQANVGDQQKRLLASRHPPVRAVLWGSLANPQLSGSRALDPVTMNQLRILIANARSGEAAPLPRLRVNEVEAPPASLTQDRSNTALYGQMLLFFLTLLLSGMVMSQLIEEKSNKIIEVIAAAVPIDAMFLGKLFAMLAASIVGIIVWISAGALLIQMFSHGGLHTLPPPAVGWPAFLALGIVYFAMNYLLLGAVFLSIGALASTAREVQTLSMPVTFAQVLIFGFAATAIGTPDSARGIAAAVFPLSSPMAMLARAAQQPDWWPHVAAIGWQALWVAVILRIGSRLFRKTVLKSGPQAKWWRRAIGTS